MKKMNLYLLVLILFNCLTLLNKASSQVPYAWKQRANFGGVARSGSIGFSIGNFGYIGAGYNGVNLSDFWQYDPSTNTWTQKSSLPTVLRYASSFVINDSGYVTGGITNATPFNNTLYMYNPTTNTWVTKAPFPGDARYGAAGFAIANKGYFGIGNSGSRFGPYLSDFYQYDPSTNSWTQKATFPGTTRYGVYGISLNGEGYVGFGGNENLNVEFNDWWQYDPSADAWTSKTNYPGSIRSYPTGFVINNFIYIGTGIDGIAGVALNDLYQYNPITSTWTQEENYTPGDRWLVSGFAIRNIGYFGTGTTEASSAGSTEFYEYAPDSMQVNSTQKNVTCYGGSDGYDSLKVSGGVSPFKYLWSPGGQTTSSISGLSEGQYICVVTDSLGLAVSDTVNITQPIKLKASATGNLSICNGQSTTLNASATGGTGVDTYIWDGSSTGSSYLIAPVLTSNHYLIATDAVGCKSDTFFFGVTVNQPTSSSSNPVICNGATVTLPDGSKVSPATSTSYVTHILNAAGCDSAITTFVTVNQPTSSSADVIICNGQSVTLPDGSSVSPTTSTSYIIHKTNAANCDSAITTNITVNQPTSSSANVTICNGQSVTLPDGSSVSPTISTSYITHKTNAANCDSAITTNVKVNQPTSSSSTVSICNGQSVTLPDGSSVTPTTSTSYITHKTNAASCDSAIITNVNVNQPTSSSSTVTICNGQSVTLPDGSSVHPSVSTSYVTHKTNAGNCDSAITTNVNVNQPTSSSSSVTICNGQSVTLPDGSSVHPSVSTNYVTHKTNAANCDSAITTIVNVNQPTTSSATITICNGQSATLPDGSIVHPTSTTSYVTHKTNAANCDSAITTTVKVNQIPVLSINSNGATTICQNSSLSLTVSGATTYLWSLNSQIAATITITTGGTYSVIGTTNSCSSTASITISNIVCTSNNEHCAYSKGFYGHSGTDCSGRSVTQVVTALLSTPLITGGGARTVTILPSEVSCEISKVNGGTAPAILPLGNVTCATAIGSSYLTSKGVFNNVLLAQTITLGLNLRNDPTLGAVVLAGPYMTTYKASSCTNGVEVPNTKMVFTIPQNVLSYLGSGNTITNLLALANKALGGIYIPGRGQPSLSDINNAVDAINSGFDECRILAGFSSSSSCSGSRIAEQPQAAEINVNAYPNPFTSSTTIEFQRSTTDARVLVEVYSLSGMKISILFDNQVEAGVTYKVEFDGSELTNGIYIYRISSNDNVTNGKLVLMK